MENIDQVVIVGGTHGNELSGIYLHELIQNGLYQANRPSLSVQSTLANTAAIKRGVRYVDQDLNRLFANDGHGVEPSSQEAKIAEHLKATYTQADHPLIIDLHNTTSNMGATLILLDSSLFYKQMGAYVKQIMPEANIVFEDQIPWHEQHYLCSMGQYGLMIEVGAQPHGSLQYETLELMKTMLSGVLDYLEHVQQQTLPTLTCYEAYFYLNAMKLPLDELGMRTAMVHPKLHGQDFVPLKPGDPLFITFSGEDIYWDGEQCVYPHFINESAYCLSHVAMELADKQLVDIQTP